MLFFIFFSDSYLPNNCWHKTRQLAVGFVTLLLQARCRFAGFGGGDGSVLGWPCALQHYPHVSTVVAYLKCSAWPQAAARKENAT